MEKIVRHLIPCPAYDIEAMESWLTDLAGEGLLLKREGISFGFAYFQVGEPQETAYRLVGAWNRPTPLEAAVPIPAAVKYVDPQPQEEALEMNRFFGWEYVARRGKFFIYRSTIPQPRELDTDPQVQFWNLRALAQWNTVEFFWLLPCLAIPCLRLSAIDGFSFQALFLSAPALVVTFFLLLLSGLLHRFRSHLHMGDLTRKLKRGLPLEHNRDWKSIAPGYYLRLAVTAGIWGLFALSTVCVLFGFSL